MVVGLRRALPAGAVPGRASTDARRQVVELSVVLTITTARRFGPLSSVRFIGFHSPHQLCQFLREGRRNNVVECPPQVAPERQRELHWIERCGRPTTHGHTSPREAFPALTVFRKRTWRSGVPFPRRELGFLVPTRVGRVRASALSSSSAGPGSRPLIPRQPSGRDENFGLLTQVCTPYHSRPRREFVPRLTMVAHPGGCLREH